MKYTNIIWVDRLLTRALEFNHSFFITFTILLETLNLIHKKLMKLKVVKPKNN